MNKADLIDSVAESTDMSKAEAGRALDAVLDGISGALSNGDQVALVGFGTFLVRERAARMGRNLKLELRSKLLLLRVLGLNQVRLLKKVYKSLENKKRVFYGAFFLKKLCQHYQA